jgi:hypothetical protein
LCGNCQEQGSTYRRNEPVLALHAFSPWLPGVLCTSNAPGPLRFPALQGEPIHSASPATGQLHACASRFKQRREPSLARSVRRCGGSSR